MILVDTSVWVAHLRAGDQDLAARLEAGEVLSHPFVIGEIAMGNLRDRSGVLAALRNLPGAEVATDAEVQAFIDREALHGLGIGYVDAHLLASVRLTRDSRLWTFDRRLAEVAVRMDELLRFIVRYAICYSIIVPPTLSAPLSYILY